MLQFSFLNLLDFSFYIIYRNFGFKFKSPPLNPLSKITDDRGLHPT